MINLLIVDDEVLVRTSVQSFMDWESEGFTFIGAVSNGEEGLQFLNDHPETDIILLDIHMPLMDGISMMRELKKRNLTLPVLILSANNQFEYVREAFQLGAVDYILKSEMDDEILLKQLKEAGSKISKTSGEDQSINAGEKKLIINSLLEDLLEGKNPEMNRKLVEDLGFRFFFPSKMGIFSLEETEADEQAVKIIQLRGEELLKQRGGGSFHILSENRALFFVKPEEAFSFSSDFSEILKDAMNLTPDINLSCICEDFGELPGQFRYMKKLDSGQSRIIRKAKSYIRKHYSSPGLSLEEVSLYVEVSRTHLSAQFKKESGQTFRDYLTHVRIEAAKKLLDETNLKVYEICENVGYPNVEHFSRIFKKLTGTTPNRYHR
ncbi:MAG: response regulator [Spirochaetales bacterium]|nr:response regulator [Spirochaetales bacterium]